MKNIYDDKKMKQMLADVEKRMRDLFYQKLDAIILYGSYARGDFTYDSDVDIMVLVDEQEEDLRKYDDKITDIMVDLSLKYNIVVSLYVQSVQNYNKYVKMLPFYKNVQKEGIRVYGWFHKRISFVSNWKS